MSVLIFTILVGALLSSLLLPTPKPKPRKGLPAKIDWSRVVH